MKLTLEIDGIVRVFQGSYDEMINRDWNTRVRNILDDASDYDEETLCGKPHNNGDEDGCMECGVIKLGI